MDLAAFLTAFGLIFAAELPDKTAYTVLLLSARGRPVQVLLGAWTAFFLQGLVAVGLGSLFMRLPPQAVRWIAAGTFLFFGLLLLLRKDDAPPPEPAAQRRAYFFRALALVFLAEMGDATQLGTAALVARLHARWSVFAGSTLALWAVSALAATLGSKLGSRVPKRILRRAAAALFLIFALASALA